MATTRSDLEYQKFTTDLAGDTAIRTTATISGDVNIDVAPADNQGIIGKPSGGDFTTAYLAGTTITCASLPTYHSTLINQDLVIVQQINSSGTVVNTYSRPNATMTVAGNVVTVVGATFAASDTFVIYTNIARQADYEIGAVELKNSSDDTRATVNAANALKVYDYIANSLVPATYDYIALSYTGSNLTGVVYKTGGAGGTTVSTLTLAYTGSVLDSITKT